MYISKGFAHGYRTLENNTIVTYKVSNYYSPQFQRSINYLDSDISVESKLIKGSKKCNCPSLSINLKKEVTDKHDLIVDSIINYEYSFNK